MIQLADKLNLYNSYYSLRAVFEETEPMPTYLVQEMFHITYYIEDKKAVIYLGKRANFGPCCLQKVITSIIKQNKNGFNVYVETFVNDQVSKNSIVQVFTNEYIYQTHTFWNKKSEEYKRDLPKHEPLVLVGPNDLKDTFSEAVVLAKNVNVVRNLQIMPHNYLNSEIYAEYVKEMFRDMADVEIKVLDKKEILAENMGLFLGVNAGSAYEPRCIIVTYKGDAGSSDHLVMVGKGITFDSGGMNLKPSNFILGMKYDMSGSAIVAGTVRTIAELKSKVNVSAILMVTDNAISNTAIRPDDVLIASNGLSVEINNTDAEGRLVLADGLVYAWKRLKATKLIDVATLTGAIKVALGDTYTGVWATQDQDWVKVQAAARQANEGVWRMPLHSDYFVEMNKSLVADFKNTNLGGYGGSSSATMFLTKFTNNLPYIHFDIAGTGKIDDNTTGVMLKTLTYFAKS